MLRFGVWRVWKGLLLGSQLPGCLRKGDAVPVIFSLHFLFI